MALNVRLHSAVQAWSAEDDSQAAPLTTTYLQETRDHLDTLPPLALSTLRHLVVQDMQVFTAERDSVLLRRLARMNLLHPMGSSVHAAHAYPFRIPSVVWSELKRRHVSPTARASRGFAG